LGAWGGSHGFQKEESRKVWGCLEGERKRGGENFSRSLRGGLQKRKKFGEKLKLICVLLKDDVERPDQA